MRKLGWLADPGSWGPMTRAQAVMQVADVTVLSPRGWDPREWGPLAPYSFQLHSCGCCGDQERQLAALEADVLVADPSWWELADLDGRPWISLGWTGWGASWDLDLQPLHPWAYGLGVTRQGVREEWGTPPDCPVIACMSPSGMPHWIENRVRDVIPAGAQMVELTGVGAARQMLGADLVVCSAGWASSVEARWSGVPHILMNSGGPDQQPRITHELDEARELVGAVQLQDLPADWAGCPDAEPLLRFLTICQESPPLSVG